MILKATTAALAATLTLTATAAAAGEWRLIGIAKSSGIGLAVDASAISGPQTARSIPVAIALRSTTSTAGLSYDYQIEQRLIDCLSRTSTTRSRGLFLATGVQVAQSPLDGGAMPVAANTLDDLILQAACKGQWMAVQPVAGAPDFVRAVRPLLTAPAS